MDPYYSDEQVTLLLGDSLNVLGNLPDGSVNCIVTPPPYFGLRDYGTPGQYGLEATPAAYVETMRALFAEARRVLADDGTLWLNIGDSYVRSPKGGGGLAAKQLIGTPWRVAFALQDDGWTLRNAIIWHKPNAMPERVLDRMSTKYEEIFLFSKSAKYWFDMDAVRVPHTTTLPVVDKSKRSRHRYPTTDWETRGADQFGSIGYGKGGKNPGDVWPMSTAKFPKAHFATFPLDLPLRCIKAGCKPDGIVLDPFSGAGTTGLAALQLGRKYIGIDLNPAYHDLTKERFAQGVLEFDTA